MSGRRTVGWLERLGPGGKSEINRTSFMRILSVLKRRGANPIEPDTAWTLPADSDFGRGFDSRRLHQL